MKLLIAQGGGPTAVINQSLIGAIDSAQKNELEIIGARQGIQGIIGEDLVNLLDIEGSKLLRIAKTPSSALGSTRDKPDAQYCEGIIKIFKKHNIRGFLYIGGNDSSETIRLILKSAENNNYEMKGFHIPKTIDNDLVKNDHTPGFPSAARFVAKAIMGLDRDNEALPGIHICIIMGRHAGFLTAAGALGGAHRIYIPEQIFDLEEFAKETQETIDEHGRALLAISEGIQSEDGKPIVSQFVKQEIDAHGNAQLSGLPLGNALASYLKANIDEYGKLRIRQDTFGYIQRSFPDPSPIDEKEAKAVGEKAVQACLDKSLQSGSITIERVSNSPYESMIGITDLEGVANQTRKLPEEYYDPRLKRVTAAGLRYLRPLVGELPSFESI